MSLRAYINHLIWLSDNADKKEKEIDRKYGIDSSIGINPLDLNVLSKFPEYVTAVRELESYLTTLDLSSLLSLEAILYYGRDGGDLIELQSNLLDKFQSKEDTIRTLVEKRGTYSLDFNNALNEFENQNIDIDTLFK